LDLSSCGLQEIPADVFGLTWLASLDLSLNSISSVPAGIAQLDRLQILNLWQNTGVTLPAQIGRLRELRMLMVGPKCGTLPSEIGLCGQLTHLSIGGNNLGHFPEWLRALRILEDLQLWESSISRLPDHWQYFPRLRRLNLTRNRISSIPPGFGALASLRYLNLSDNELADLPGELRGLQGLEVAMLGGNNFSRVPDVVATWRELRALDLSATPFRADVHDDMTVHLYDERIGGAPSGSRGSRDNRPLRELHPGLRDLPKLKWLILHGNPGLELPEEILGDAPIDAGDYEMGEPGPWACSVPQILDYYFRTRGGARPLNEAKLILLGWGGAGKTSLVNRLVHQRFDPAESRTEGIEITSWPVELSRGDQVRLNVWDFGGQEIMHATHQFFLTSRTVYLVVLNGRSGSADADAEYWLKIVTSFAPDSPVVVILNQIERDPFELDETGLRQRYPNIRQFIRTDCAAGDEGRGIEDLRASILATTGSLKDLRVKFPAAWFSIKDRLAGMSENYLTFERYREICAQAGEVDGQAQERLADYLHSLGIALNYRDDSRLRDTHVLNPHWATEGIYAILNSRLIAGQHGEAAISDLAQILDPSRYPRERHAFLLDLMRRFELCFPYTDEPDRYLIADLLPKQQPRQATSFPADDSLRFEYRYPILPEGLLPRFIVRSRLHSAGQPRWRSGALLSWEQNHALIQADAADNVIRIAVTGEYASRRRLLAVIRSDFDHINSSYRFPIGAYVPVGGTPGLSIEYAKLLAAEKAGMSQFPEFFAGEFVNINVRSLLEGVDLKAPVHRGGAAAEQRGSRVRLFISYSHEDERHRDALESHLKVLKSAGLVDIWHDRRIDPGDDWKGQIGQALEEADIMVLLVSAGFLASDYCNDVELRRALERRAAGDCTVVPVLVRDSMWQKVTAIAALQALPANGRPVTRWPNRDSAWRTVADGLERVISGIAQNR
jgi:internalin A